MKCVICQNKMKIRREVSCKNCGYSYKLSAIDYMGVTFPLMMLIVVALYARAAVMAPSLDKWIVLINLSWFVFINAMMMRISVKFKVNATANAYHMNKTMKKSWQKQMRILTHKDEKNE